jgi:predicted 3-demethylubiquinone-9 3-methyltransferase (glyoxalase superfamily)
MQKISPCLWFDNQAEEAAKFYTSIFKNSKIGKTANYSKSSAQASGQKEGKVMTVEFEIEGKKFLGLNGGPMFKFNPAVSFFVWCKTEKEVDQLWKSLSQGGSVLMELNKYPWSEKYGWCEDKFGVSWQIMLGDVPYKIAPALLFVNDLFGKGEDAIHFYVSQFKNSKVQTMHKDPNTNTVMHSIFTLDGEPFVLMEGPGDHKKHQINHAISFMVNCKDQQEIDSFWEKLVQGGGATEQCGWLHDKFGVCWQIIPAMLSELLNSKNTEKVMAAVMQMRKLDIEKMKAAAQE